MEVKPGYKQTEVGMIPDEWDVKPLGSVLRKGRLGGNYPNQDREAGNPLMKMGNIARGYIDTAKVEYITPGITPDPNHRLCYGDVLFNTRNTLDLVGKVAIWRNELSVAYYNSNLMRLEFEPQEVCSNEYANYALNSAGGVARLRALATGTTSVAAIYTRDLLGMLFVVPPPPEQRAIARALSDVDALIGALDKLIAKKRDIKQAAMQQLLTGQKRLPGFHGKWEVKRLGNIAEIRDGTHQTPKYVESGVPFFSVENVTSGDFTNTKFISEAEHRFLTKSFKIEKGDILMTRIGSIGDCKLIDWDVDASFYVSLALLKIHMGYSAAFICHYSKSASFKKEVELHSLQSAIPKKINLGPISDVRIEIPTGLTEQTAIAEVLSDMDAELAALEQRRATTRALKQGMMQELLTGKTRLPFDEGTPCVA